MNPDDLQRALLDPTAPIPAGWPAGALGVLLLFLIPVGGGIPAGVLMAHARGIAWPVIMGLYLISDVILACLFEPLLRLLIAVGRMVPLIGRATRAVRAAVQNTAAQYGNAGGPLALVLVSFGVDPMTGRAAAAAAGHGFVPGWTIAITGDMFYFALLMTSTLCLGDVLGNDRLTIGVMLFVMLVLPAILKRWRRSATVGHATDSTAAITTQPGKSAAGGARR
jgi:hypothetical protein